MSNNNIKIWSWSNSKLRTFNLYFWYWINRKKILLEFNNYKFILYKVMIKQSSILQQIEARLDLKIDIQNDPYAFTKSIIHHEFKI